MKRSLSALIFTLATLLASPAHAATQGTLGATSSGNVTITVSVASRAQISGLSDVVLANADPASTAANSQQVCVWSNTGSKGYSITASGSGANGGFSLANGTQTAPYSVAWSPTAGQADGIRLNSGSTLGGLTSGAAVPDCSSGSPSSSLIVTMAPADLRAMKAEKTYSGMLTLIVRPQ